MSRLNHSAKLSMKVIIPIIVGLVLVAAVIGGLYFYKGPAKVDKIIEEKGPEMMKLDVVPNPISMATCYALALSDESKCDQIPDKEGLDTCKDDYCLFNALKTGDKSCISIVKEKEVQDMIEFYTSGSLASLDVSGCDSFGESLLRLGCKAAIKDDLKICEENPDGKLACRSFARLIIGLKNSDDDTCRRAKGELDTSNDEFFDYSTMCSAIVTGDHKNCRKTHNNMTQLNMYFEQLFKVGDTE